MEGLLKTLEQNDAARAAGDTGPRTPPPMDAAELRRIAVDMCAVLTWGWPIPEGLRTQINVADDVTLEKLRELFRELEYQVEPS